MMVQNSFYSLLFSQIKEVCLYLIRFPILGHLDNNKLGVKRDGKHKSLTNKVIAPRC